MKTAAVVFIILVMICQIGVASPASPIWTGSPDNSGENINSFWRNPFDLNWSLQKNQMNYLAVVSVLHKGTRFNVGSRIDQGAFGDENKMIIAGLDKRINENWWLSIGYQGGSEQQSIMNIGAAYLIGSNAIVTFGYSFQNTYEMKNAIRTQFIINF